MTIKNFCYGYYIPNFKGFKDSYSMWFIESQYKNHWEGMHEQKIGNKSNLGKY